jgi:hypothetical protein
MGRKENKVEARIQLHVKRLGGIHRKVVYQGRRGSPDQWCKLPGYDWILIEAKAEDGVVSPQQADEINTLIDHGANVRIFWSVEQVDEFFKGF